MVVVGGEVDEPEVLLRGRVEMADARLAGSKQPYHQVEELPLQKAARRLARLSESAGAMARDAIQALVDVRQRDLADRAAATLRRSPSQLSTTVQALGRTLGPPWGADQKSAALLAWLVLAETEADRAQ